MAKSSSEVDFFRALAIDLGSSSGRAVLGHWESGVLEHKEICRWEHSVNMLPDGGLVWDLPCLTEGILEAVAKACKIGPVHSIGIDSWGVDYVFVDKTGNPVAPARAYRDERTQLVVEEFSKKIPPMEQFQLSGVFPQAINTSYQLAAANLIEADVVAKADGFLFLSDYFARKILEKLGGAEHSFSPEVSLGVSSTSGLIGLDGTWQPKLCQATGIPENIFPQLKPELEVIGEGSGVSVVRAGSHDTACAVHSLPHRENGIFISCGSWTLVGACVDNPVISAEVFQAGYTNERRTDGGVRLQANLTGLWLAQECLRYWRQNSKNKFEELFKDPGNPWSILNNLTNQALKKYGRDIPLIDPADSAFMAPSSMPQRIHSYLEEKTGSPQPDDPGFLLAVIYCSLAQAHAQTIRKLREITGIKGIVQFVGGGVGNPFLAQLTADALGENIWVGEAESSALGNLIAQIDTCNGGWSPEAATGRILRPTV